MPKILVTNDDGIHSAGIIKLAEALEEVGDVLASMDRFATLGIPVINRY